MRCQEIWRVLHWWDFERSILVYSMWCQKTLHWQDFECSNISLFNAMPRDLRRFALTRLRVCKYLSIQCDVERFEGFCIDKTLSVQLLVYSMWCQEIWRISHWQDFKRTNIGSFNVTSRDLWRFALTRSWSFKY